MPWMQNWRRATCSQVRPMPTEFMLDYRLDGRYFR